MLPLKKDAGAAPVVMRVVVGKVLPNSAKELVLGVLLVVTHDKGHMVHLGHDVNVLNMLWVTAVLVGHIFQEGCAWRKMIKKSAVFSAILGYPPPVSQ